MNIGEHQNKVRQEMARAEDYDIQRQAVQEYIVFLEKVLEVSPHNVKAASQLAIARLENNEDVDACIDLLETTINNSRSYISEADFCELINNLAFFYDEEKNDLEKARDLLLTIVNLKSCHEKSYYALAYLLVETDPMLALDHINRIDSMSQQPAYMRYMKAYVLLRAGDQKGQLCHNKSYYDALQIFEDLAKTCSDTRLADRALYTSALVRHVLKDERGATDTADMLYKKYIENVDVKISTFELVHLYFLLKKHDKVVSIFERDMDTIYLNTDDTKMYLYALSQLGQDKKADEVFSSKIKEIQEENVFIQSDDDYTPEEKNEYIDKNIKAIDRLAKVYIDMSENNTKVSVKDIFYACNEIKQCYLMGCLRHE